MNISKQILLVYFNTLFFTFSGLSQVNNTCDSLIKAYEKGSIMLQDRKYVINGESFKMGFGQRKIGEALKKNPIAYTEFELFKKKQTKGMLYSLIGGGATIASILTNKNSDKTLSTGLSIVGIGFLAVSFPITSKSKKHFNKAIWLYNRDVLKY
jgi:hypothetical protein